MNEQQLIARNAENHIQQLETLHSKFVAELQNSAKRTSEVGILDARSDSITCRCLGQSVVAKHRPVVVNGHVSALEYDFIVRWRDVDVSVLRLYLRTYGELARNVEGSVKFQDFNNAYISEHVLAAVSVGLLSSPVFAPAGS